MTIYTSQHKLFGRIFLAPASLVVLLLSLFPLFFSLGMTFTDMRLARPEIQFIGFANWVRLFGDARFKTTLWNTVTFVLAAVALQYALGLFLALLLNQRFRGRAFFRLSFLLPMMMSPVAVSFMLGKLIFSESAGPVTKLTAMIGLGPLRWSMNALASKAVLLAVDTWQWTPFFLLVLLAGLQSVDIEMQEAAFVDGATPWQVVWHIVWPTLLPLSSIAILIRSLEVFKIIDIVRVVTGGGPGSATESVTLYAYDMGLRNGDIAYATTMAYVLLLVTIIFATLYLRYTRRFAPTCEASLKASKL